ncbi:MAG: hypothetical protein Q4G27_07655 [Flavobacteriaceae bacterium]|nr:hypothetical protein [Flavobacteriaceae bacterium]
MGQLIEIILIAIIAYFIFNWIRKIFMLSNPRNQRQPGVRIFKKGEIEKSTVDVSDAETVEYEEIKKTDFKD